MKMKMKIPRPVHHIRKDPGDFIFFKESPTFPTFYDKSGY